MRVFTFIADGEALGSTIVIVASHKATAEKMAREWLEENTLAINSLVFIKSKPLNTPAIVYSWNGDY